MNKTPEGKFMVAVGAIIQHSKYKKILLIKRSKDWDFRPGIWEYPIGRMKQFEELDVALHRELAEEIGLQQFTIIKPISVFHFFRGERIAENEVVGIVYWIKTDTEAINLSEEHEEYKWMTIDELKEIKVKSWIRRDINTFIKESSK